MSVLKDMQLKFTVVKNADLDNYLDDNDRNTFYYLVEDQIGYIKQLEGKKENT